jgi:protein O-mannosyl-transferase
MKKTIGFLFNWKYIAIVILTTIAYLPIFSGDFVLDDIALIKNNTFIKESHSIQEYFNQEDGVVDRADAGKYHSGYYRPLINLTYILDYKIWGNNAVGFRITNLFLHILFVIVFLNFISIYLDKQVAFWFALIFSLHPVNTESVSVITSRNNIIAALFIVSSLWSYIIGWERNKSVGYIFSLIFFIGAVLSKEFGLMVIPLIFLYQRLLTRQKYGVYKELINYIPFLIIAILYLLLRKGVTDSILTPANMGSIWTRLFFAPFIIFYNLKLIFLPNGLHFIELNYPANIFNWLSSISLLMFLLMLILLWAIRKERIFIFSVLAFLICIFPTVNIIPSLCISLIGMRWLYVSMGFLLLGVGFIVQKAFIYRRNIIISILVVLITYLGLYTYSLNKGLWYDQDTFIKQEVIGFNNYLFASDMGEQFFNNKQYLKAEEYFKIATERYPHQIHSYISLSALYIETGRLKEAVYTLNKADSLVMTHHEQGEWQNNMGMALSKMGDKENGLRHLRKAVISAPDEPIFWINLGGFYGMIGDYHNSLDAFKKGLAISPESIQLRTNLALTYINLKNFQEAVTVLSCINEKEMKKNPEALRLLRQAQTGL